MRVTSSFCCQHTQVGTHIQMNTHKRKAEGRKERREFFTCRTGIQTHPLYTEHSFVTQSHIQNRITQSALHVRTSLHQMSDMPPDQEASVDDLYVCLSTSYSY